MALQKSVYLTDRTLSAQRTGDSLSGRINMIVDRYLEIIRCDRSDVRGLFDGDEWATLRKTYRVVSNDAIAAIPSLARELSSEKLRLDLKNLSGGDAFVLLELLEEEAMAEA